MTTRAPTSRPILVVDDDTKILRLVRTYLERAGYRVVEASDGRTGLSAIALEAPALVVLDVMLPEVDGLARPARRPSHGPNAHHHPVPPVGLTDDAYRRPRRRGRRLLPKPSRRRARARSRDLKRSNEAKGPRPIRTVPG